MNQSSGKAAATTRARRRRLSQANNIGLGLHVKWPSPGADDVVHGIAAGVPATWSARRRSCRASPLVKWPNDEVQRRGRLQGPNVRKALMPAPSAAAADSAVSQPYQWLLPIPPPWGLSSFR